MPPIATLALVGLVVGLVRGPVANGAGSRAPHAGDLARNGTPIVADDLIDEQVALAGGRIWVGNPIDAFSKQRPVDVPGLARRPPSGLRALGPDVRVV